MRIARLIAAAAVTVGGLGLIGCQGDPDTRHAEAGSYDSQRMNDKMPSGSLSTGAGVGTGGSSTVYPDARQSGARPDVDRSGEIVQPTDPAPGTAGNAADTGNGSAAPAATGADRTTGSERRVPNLQPGDRGAGNGVRGTSAPGLGSDGIKRGSGGGGNDTRD